MTDHAPRQLGAAGARLRRAAARRRRSASTAEAPRLPDLRLQARDVLAVRPDRDEDQKRDNAEELRLKSELERELPIEHDLSRWFALFDASAVGGPDETAAWAVTRPALTPGCRGSDRARRTASRVSSSVRSLGGMTMSEVCDLVVGAGASPCAWTIRHIASRQRSSSGLVVCARAPPPPRRRARRAARHGVVEPVLPFAHEPDDHDVTFLDLLRLGRRSRARPSASRARRRPARGRRLRQLPVERALAGRREVLERSCVDELVDGGRTRLHVLGLVLRALDRRARRRPSPRRSRSPPRRS